MNHKLKEWKRRVKKYSNWLSLRAVMQKYNQETASLVTG